MSVRNPLCLGVSQIKTMQVFVVLLRNPGYRRSIKFEACSQSKLMTELLSDLGDQADVELPLDVERAEIMDVVIDFMHMHIDNPTIDYEHAIKTNKLVDLIGEADANFLGARVAPLDDLVDLTNTANYLDCQGLLKVCIAALAVMVWGTPTEEACKRFGVPEVLSIEEKRELHKKNLWLFELAYKKELEKARATE